VADCFLWLMMKAIISDESLDTTPFLSKEGLFLKSFKTAF
jgi:hypothetical protein